MALDADDSFSRTKAAAWAWYQRSGGGVSPSLGRSEAFASRCYTPRPPSRFKLEASKQPPQPQPAADFMISTSSTEAELAPSLQLEAALEHEECRGQLQQLDVVSLHPSFWDCGSSLFDSFELVAMSQKLDVELSEPRIGSDDLHLQPQQPQLLLLCDSSHSSSPAPPAPASLSASEFLAAPSAEAAQFLSQPPPPSSSPLQHNLDHEVFQDLYPYSIMTPELNVSITDRHSKQAIYDMFCQFGDANKQPAKKETWVNGGDVRKHKLTKHRMSFHSLAKALHHIAHLTHSAGQERYRQRQHHHHHHYSPPLHHQQFPGKAGNCAYGIPSTSPPGGDRLPNERAEEESEKLRHPQKHIHHHHHHHYHYLFHSDDDFRLQPLDKSLMVAAAGLRAPKINPALSSYLEAPRAEYGLESVRKWADFGSVPASGGPIVQQWRC